MAKINQDLLERLARKLDVSEAQVYAKIARANREWLLERHLAALKFAAGHGVSIHRYASPEDLLQLQGVGRPNPQASAPELNVNRKAVPNRRRSSISSATKGKAKTRNKDNSVFVVHGRNEALRRSMFEFLRALGLNPKEWEAAVLEAKGGNPDIGDIIETAMKKVSAVVVLLSPDDEAKLKDEFCKRDEKRTEGKLQGQARPNVIFEAGLALGSHPEKTLIVQVGKVRKFSDIAGKHIAHLSNDTARRNDVANRLHKITGKVSKVGSDWISAGNFDLA